MSKFEDGSYGSLTGVALIAKVLAGRCKMRYTRAAVGNGAIPDGMTPKTMTGPADYVMNAIIAAVTNPVDGECQVTVQIKSDNVETGFYCTNIVLYAEDPDEGEVPYTYLCLENEPEWIRPASSIVGKFATFDIIAAVGDVDVVTAVIDPDSIVTHRELDEAIAKSTAVVQLNIPTEGWDDAAVLTGTDEPKNGLYIDIPIKGVKDTMPPSLTVHPLSTDTALDCGLRNVIKTYDGGVRLYAMKKPMNAITATVVITCSTSSIITGSTNVSSGIIDENGVVVEMATAEDVKSMFK